MPAPESFCPPALPDVGATYPDRALLTIRGYIADRRNATTAASFTSEGYPIQVTFVAAEPPALSHICVHCPDAPCFFVEPQVLASQGDLVLLLVSLGSDPFDSSCDYFVYRASADGRPSLDLLPDPEHNIHRGNAGLIPSVSGRGGGYTVVTLTPDLESKGFILWLYREKTRRWRRKVVPRKPLPEESTSAAAGDKTKLKLLPFSPTKVTAIPGSSTVAWVDIRRAVVLCDVLAKHAVAEYIPLPEPLSDVNREHLESIADPAFLRDAIGQNDSSVRFVEMEYRYDQPGYVPNGWRAVTRTWTTVGSGSGGEGRRWRTDSVVDFAGDVLRNTAACTLSPLCRRRPDDDGGGGQVSPENVPLFVPTLCDRDGVFYLTSKVSSRHPGGWVAAVDTSARAVEAVARMSEERLTGYSLNYILSTFPKHLKGSSFSERVDAPQTRD